MRYVIATNTGKGFITHEESAKLSFSGYPENLWVIKKGSTSDQDAWITKVNGTETDIISAQQLMNDHYTTAKAAYDALPEEEKGSDVLGHLEPKKIILPI